MKYMKQPVFQASKQLEFRQTIQVHLGPYPPHPEGIRIGPKVEQILSNQGGGWYPNPQS